MGYRRADLASNKSVTMESSPVAVFCCSSCDTYPFQDAQLSALLWQWGAPWAPLARPHSSVTIAWPNFLLVLSTRYEQPTQEPKDVWLHKRSNKANIFIRSMYHWWIVTLGYGLKPVITHAGASAHREAHAFPWIIVFLLLLQLLLIYYSH